jgi:hypothetical protein
MNARSSCLASVILGLGLLCSLPGLSGTLRAAPLQFPGAGFSIEPFDIEAGEVEGQFLMLFLPAVEGFSPNVGLQVQPFPETMAAYAEVSREQFAQMGWKVLREENRSENEWVVEYSGQLQNMALHFFSRALLHEGKVYLLTGVSLASRWEKDEAALRKVVDSFTLQQN